MSRARPERAAQTFHGKAPIFAALGDPTQLTLLVKLGSGPLMSITRLAEDSALTRQAITKHVRVLQQAGLVRGFRRGRENLLSSIPRGSTKAHCALDVISQHGTQPARG